MFKPIAILFLNSYRWQRSILVIFIVLLCESCWYLPSIKSQTASNYVLPDNTYNNDIYQLAQSTTVRIFHDKSSGSGIIINRRGNVYTVLTNWHVVSTDKSYRVLTQDGQTYALQKSPKRLGKFDLALIEFNSFNDYQIATIGYKSPQVGEKVYSAGFPLYNHNRSTNTISLGIEIFHFSEGEVSLIPAKSMLQGYQLGYTNDIEVGMSGGPIFNAEGLLIGINGRQKYGDPDFGAYIFEDGSDPDPAMLETMINSSWGIPITTYLQFASHTREN
ncbi:MAG: serine protease [Xenococcaceae cyanobacterium MO_188.B19]|nr:serine protease [Xenococcaceae cyanobacterium MO_188.B19]